MDAPRSGGSMPPQPHSANIPPQLKQQQQQQAEMKGYSQPIPPSPSRLPHHVAASPSLLRSSSPRLHSPASSEIFERNVQEPIPISTLEGEMSPAHIPAHVITEDSIPAALQASAQAITSPELNPDDVEIVTSASHQPAAAAVLDGSISHELTPLNSHTLSPPPPPLQHQKSDESEGGLSLHGAEDESASNYGQLDPTDVRRLSFISFKDIVHSENQHLAASSLSEIGSRDSLHGGNLPSGLAQEHRAASPLRSPRSPASTHSPSMSSGITTPPPGVSVNTVMANAEQSPARSTGLGSPGQQHGELTIETMRQALRKTASGDLSNARSAMSPVVDEYSSKDIPRSRTNT